MSGRNSQVARVIKIARWLENSKGGLTVVEIHKRLVQDFGEVSIRTIYRDLDAIDMAGIPLVQDSDADGVGRWSVFHVEKKCA